MPRMLQMVIKAGAAQQLFCGKIFTFLKSYADPFYLITHHKNGGSQSGISKSLCKKLSLHENLVFAANIIFIMWNSVYGLDTWYHFRFNISCVVAVIHCLHF